MEPSLTPAEALVDAFARHLALQRRSSPRTVQAYRDIVSRLLQNAGGVNGLGPDSLRAFLREARPRLAAASQAQWASALRTFLIWAAREGHVKAGLEREVSRPRVPRPLVEAVDEEDLPLLLQTLAKRPAEEQLLFELLYGSGLRLSEALELQFKNIDLRAGTAEILGKGRRRRRVPLSPRAREILSAAQGSGSVWPRKISLRGLRRWVENWGRVSLLGKDGEGRLYPHKLRHSIASHLLRRGARLPQIQKLLGHSRLSTTERYTHLNPEDLLRAYDKAFPKLKED